MARGVEKEGDSLVHLCQDDQRHCGQIEVAIVKPWIEEVVAGRSYVFQQDSAPAHAARKTQKWLEDNFFDHVTPDMWPPNSPDCNPLDYYVWVWLKGSLVRLPVTTKLS